MCLSEWACDAFEEIVPVCFGKSQSRRREKANVSPVPADALRRNHSDTGRSVNSRHKLDLAHILENTVW